MISDNYIFGPLILKKFSLIFAFDYIFANFP